MDEPTAREDAAVTESSPEEGTTPQKRPVRKRKPPVKKVAAGSGAEGTAAAASAGPAEAAPAEAAPAAAKAPVEKAPVEKAPVEKAPVEAPAPPPAEPAAPGAEAAATTGEASPAKPAAKRRTPSSRAGRRKPAAGTATYPGSESGEPGEAIVAAAAAQADAGVAREAAEAEADAKQTASAAAASIETIEPDSGGQPDSSTAEGAGSERSDQPARRSRRRRSRSKSGSGGSGQESQKSDEGSAAVDVADAPAALVAPAAPPEPKPSQTEGGGRQSSSGGSGSGSRSRKRKTSRRPRTEHIAPLGPRKMLVTVREDRSQIAVLEGRELIEHYVAKKEDLSIVGNIYVGRVENVLPGMEAAFLDIGEARNAVLYVGEVSHQEELDGPSPRIETLLKSGQAVVAQVTKDPMGSKGARLTTEVSIAGRYLVLVPNADSLGISRRLADNERRRLRDIGMRIRPEGHGLIVRTAAIGVNEEDLARDVNRLTRIWNEVTERSTNAKPPKLIYSEPNLAIRVIRDLFTADVEQVLADDESVYKQIREYLEEMAPDLAGRVEMYTDQMPLFERFHVTEQIRKAVDRKVWLQSGGHIIIDRTEAMTVVDVNTGRFVGRSTLEDTVLHANLEAAEEVAKQLRLRDIGGIIVIDFIDMGYERNRDELLRVFENALLRDKTRTQVYGVSELGLVQMTRKKVSEGLVESFSHRCEECEGRGIILNSFD